MGKENNEQLAHVVLIRKGYSKYNHIPPVIGLDIPINEAVQQARDWKTYCNGHHVLVESSENPATISSGCEVCDERKTKREDLSIFTTLEEAQKTTDRI